MKQYYIYVALINLLDLTGIVSAKLYYLTKNTVWLVLTVVLFAGAGFFFAKSLQYEGAAITNVLWVAISVLLVTIVGYFVFKEVITPLQLIGMLLVLAGLILITAR